MIIVKIDAMKVDKTKLFPGKNGAKYLDIILIENKNGEDQYGNHFMCVQGVSKEDRAAGVKGAILGNAKTVGGAVKPAAREWPKKEQPPQDREGDDSFNVPF